MSCPRLLLSFLTVIPWFLNLHANSIMLPREKYLQRNEPFDWLFFNLISSIILSFSIFPRSSLSFSTVDLDASSWVRESFNCALSLSFVACHFLLACHFSTSFAHYDKQQKYNLINYQSKNLKDIFCNLLFLTKFININ